MFWNGTHWVNEGAAIAPARPQQRRRRRDILATIPVLLLVPALIIPLLSVGASSYAASLTTFGSAVPGSNMTVRGTGFAPRQWIDLRWDGSPTGTTARVGSGSDFMSQVAVPSSATPGTHQISAYSANANRFTSAANGSSAEAMIAVVSVEVLGVTPDPTPTPPTAVASILAVAAMNLSQNSATITWTLSQPATGQVEYGRTTAYGSVSKPETSYRYSSHIQVLSALSAATTYHYRVKSTTAAGVSLVSGDMVFTTSGTAASPSQTSTPTPTPTPTTAPTLAPTPTPTPIATPTGAPPQTPSVQTSALNITSVAATGITSTGATISWNAGEPATGQVEFGTTSAYGQASKLEASFNYQSHIQTLSGLQSGTRYHFRVRSTDQAGNTAVSPDQVFSTTGSASSSTVTPAPTAGGSTPAPTSTTAPTPPPVVVVPAAAGSTYGVGIGGDTRNNHRIDGTVVSYRFRATTSAAPSSIKVSERGNGGANTYSGGNGGTIEATIQTDNGGKPSGTVLATLQWNPGNPSGNWEVWPTHSFASAATLTRGQLYHVVFRNVDASPSANYISLNSLYTYSGAASKPLFGADFALLEDGSVRSGDIPIFDLAYADGTHDGQSYIGNLISNYGVVAGSSSLVREHFTVSGGNRTVASASVRVRRTSGSAPLIIRLETSDGTLIDQGAVAASSIAQSAAGGDNGGSVWATVAFGSSHVLANGQTYNLVISCADGTEYTAAPLQEGTTKGLRSWAFTDGQAEKTTNGGSSWSALYPYADTAVVDLQFFFQ